MDTNLLFIILYIRLSRCTVEDPGSYFVEAACDSTTGVLGLVLHATKPIKDVRDVQWAATESEE